MNAEPLWLRLEAHDGKGARGVWALAAALLVHGGLVAVALEQEAVALPPVAVTEVELLKPAAPRPALPPEAAPVPAVPPAMVRAAARARRAAPTPSPASAASLRTIDESVQTADEPLRFVTDPSGAAFGYGTVQRGGSAPAAPAGAALPQREPGLSASQGSKNPLLSRSPQLGESEPCRGFFPPSARVDRGEVALRVRIEADGKVRSLAITREAPLGHGFGAAARDCLLSKHFAPALDQQGRAVSVVSPVTVRFSR